MKIYSLFHSDLSSIPQLKDAVVASFSSPSEEVKSAASYALGHLSCGNLQEYLPFVLSEIEANPKRQYLLLHSLKEVSFWILTLKYFFAVWKVSLWEDWLNDHEYGYGYKKYVHVVEEKD